VKPLFTVVMGSAGCSFLVDYPERAEETGADAAVDQETRRDVEEKRDAVDDATDASDAVIPTFCEGRPGNYFCADYDTSAVLSGAQVLTLGTQKVEAVNAFSAPAAKLFGVQGNGTTYVQSVWSVELPKTALKGVTLEAMIRYEGPPLESFAGITLVRILTQDTVEGGLIESGVRWTLSSNGITANAYNQDDPTYYGENLGLLTSDIWHAFKLIVVYPSGAIQGQITATLDAITKTVVFPARVTRGLSFDFGLGQYSNGMTPTPKSVRYDNVVVTLQQ
jgi:hypothetical protein